MSQGPSPATGTVEGTGATINISCGFKPSVVVLKNADGAARLEWDDSMPDASGMKTVAAGTYSYITTLGITPYEGAVGSASWGFTIGADTDVNVSAETIHWEAYRND